MFASNAMGVGLELTAQQTIVRNACFEEKYFLMIG